MTWPAAADQWGDVASRPYPIFSTPAIGTPKGIGFTAERRLSYHLPWG